MKFIKYTSKGNSVGLDDNIESYWEIDAQGYIARCIEIKPNGDVLKYCETHESDSYGQLPEGVMTKENLNDKSFGVCIALNSTEFEAIWARKAVNFN
ncbi:hypothetical protein MHO82_06045 [Vibrio sp. Of7-15]|uniref:hypothetical protein n=1 Tax=Vibrio sp. Of7-15 TaxID=2724879 RepID=UPI001EF26194|nr:hypothetical protein [Vibrio sp. Of7-15]MCG7496416.1 hypothetical protein [Vibrio sp. Of7-15]